MTTVSKQCNLCFPYAMGQLSPDEHTRFEHHLAHCASCQQEAAEVRDLRLAVEADQAQETTKNTQRTRRRRWTYRQTAIGLAAAAFALVALLPEHDALADRLHQTASHLHSGITHQVRHLDVAAYNLYTHTRVHLRDY